MRLDKQEEGFDEATCDQLVDFDYRPLALQAALHRKHALPRTRPTARVPLKLPSKDWCRQQHAQQILARQGQQIVFNNFSHSVGYIENQVTFQADFESSNLELAVRKKAMDYELYLRPDSCTTTHFQWFYFRVGCGRTPKKIKFTIKNFIKSGMLYSQGLTPFVKSSVREDGYHQLEETGSYAQNIFDEYYHLTFQYQFQSQQVVQFCSQPPYTYTRLKSRIRQSLGIKNILCRSVQGKKVPYLLYNQGKPFKAIALVIARQHPGQTVCSWMMEGFLDRLDNSDSDSVLWVVIPMMNPDGVTLGNNRTGIQGMDYNRGWNWDELPKKEKVYPQIVAFAEIVKSLRRKYSGKPRIFLDLHGHSSQPNVFSYGPPHDPSSENYLLSRTFPELMSRRNTNFNLAQCSYRLSADKRNTSRSMLLNHFNIPYCYTIQASFGILRGKQATAADFLKIGEDLADTTEDFLCNYVLGEKTSTVTEIFKCVEERAQQPQDAQEYDSEDEEAVKRTQKKSPHKPVKLEAVVTKPFESSTKCYRAKMRLHTEGPTTPPHKLSDEIHSLPSFKNEKAATSKTRYGKSMLEGHEKTNVVIAKKSRAHFLPSIKQSVSLKSDVKREPEEDLQPSMTNLKDLQKRLHKLRNSRIGKKILIINAYGI